MKFLINLFVLPGHTALHAACQEGFLDIVQILVEIGKADLTQTTNAGTSPLDFAKNNGHEHIVAYISDRLNN